MKITEEWKPIKDYEGLYEVSNLGRIKSLPKKHNLKNGHNYISKEKIVKPYEMKYNYQQVTLIKGQNKKKYLVHRLVAEAFLPNHENLPFINHKDENPKNNVISNLEWCTQKYNMNYGTLPKRASERMKKRINQYDLEGNYIKTWNSQLEIEEKLGIAQANISAVVRGKYSQTHNYKWRYADE